MDDGATNFCFPSFPCFLFFNIEIFNMTFVATRVQGTVRVWFRTLFSFLFFLHGAISSIYLIVPTQVNLAA